MVGKEREACYEHCIYGVCEEGPSCSKVHPRGKGSVVAFLNFFDIHSVEDVNDPKFKALAKSIQREAVLNENRTKNRKIKDIALSLNKVEWLRGTLYIKFKNSSEATEAVTLMHRITLTQNGKPVEAIQLSTSKFPEYAFDDKAEVKKAHEGSKKTVLVKKATGGKNRVTGKKVIIIGGKEGSKLALGVDLFLHRLPLRSEEDGEEEPLRSEEDEEEDGKEE